jgi:hypothetical protein
MSPAQSASPVRRASGNRHAVAYGGLLLFTLLLYLRPNEWLPIGTFPIVKIVGIGALVAFFVTQVTDGRPISVMPRELKLLLGLAALMLLSAAFGLDPGTSLETFSDTFLKALLIFILMVNVVTSFRRLLRLLELTVLSGTFIALGSIIIFARGENLAEGFRAGGLVGGIFGNPNDLALALNILVPIAVGLALSRRQPLLKLLYLGCAAGLAVGGLVTYSRAGLLTAGVMSAFLLVKLGRRYPLAWGVAATGLVGLMVIAPGMFWGRVLTLFSGETSAAQSAEIRWSLLQRSIEVAGFNPLRWSLGVGMNNFHIVSVHEYVNHNAYLQVFNEVGLPAAIIYLLVLVLAIHGMGRVAKAYDHARAYRHVWVTAIAIQASLVAYAVGSLFASVAYLWYVYYATGFAVCLRRISSESAPQPASLTEAPCRVWYLRRLQH